MQLNSKFARNRAEEYGFDLWGDFIIPPYFQGLELLQSNKPWVIEGGRGTGKTMLLRYLCHQTQFSASKTDYTEKDFERIGIYWKMDVQFAKLMQLRGKDDDLWINAFINMGVLIITREILICLKNIRDSEYIHYAEELHNITFEGLRDIDNDIPESLDSFIKYIHNKYKKFQLWVSNYNHIEEHPIFYPLIFVEELIDIIHNNVDIFKSTTFCVYIDEYENLIPTQKKIVNTWIKHSQSPLIFNIAMKHNSLDVRETLGEEQIVAVHDYRAIDLDKQLDGYFKVFASEILLLKICEDIDHTILENKEWLFDVSAINLRNDLSYKTSIINKLKELFPSKTPKEIAADMLLDSGISARLWEDISKDLDYKKSEVKIQDFKDLATAPETYVILHALLCRKQNPKHIYDELVKYSKGEESKFKDWVHNNLVGCILNIYGKTSRRCPLFSGFETFVLLAKDNIRHFLELCYTSLAQNQNSEIHGNLCVDIDNQVIAVKNVSQDMLYEVKQFGKEGNQLFGIALRLGTIMEQARKNDAQSEPEQTHFSINGELDEETMFILNELLKWSVLYKTKLTKQKNIEYGEEYQLNPIYSPYFLISYRKKRRMEFTNKEFRLICSGDEREFNDFLKNREKYNNIQSQQLSIF